MADTGSTRLLDRTGVTLISTFHYDRTGAAQQISCQLLRFDDRYVS
jgi:hypothetical protein